MHCPAHKSIYENETADLLANVAAKKVTHLPSKTDLIMSEQFKNRLLWLKNTTRRGLSETLWLKLGHCMLYSHKSKMNFEISPLCTVCQIKETPSHYLLECNKCKK